MLLPGDLIALGGADAEGVRVRVDFSPEVDTLQVALVRPLSELGGGAARVAGDDRLRRLVQALREVVSHEGLSDVVSGIADAALLLVPRATHATIVLRKGSEREEGKGERALGFVRW